MSLGCRECCNLVCAAYHVGKVRRLRIACQGGRQHSVCVCGLNVLRSHRPKYRDLGVCILAVALREARTKEGRVVSRVRRVLNTAASEADGVDGQMRGKADDAGGVLDEICGYPCRRWRCYMGFGFGFGLGSGWGYSSWTL